MMYAQIGTAKSHTGTTEGTLMGSTPGSDYVGFKQWADVEKGYAGGGFFSTVGISGGGVPTNIYRLYIGSELLFQISVDQENEEILNVTWRVTCLAKNGDVLTLLADATVTRYEYSFAVICAPVNVEQSLSNESNFLDAFNLTLESSGAGKGAQVRQLLIN